MFLKAFCTRCEIIQVHICKKKKKLKKKRKKKIPTQWVRQSTESLYILKEDLDIANFVVVTSNVWTFTIRSPTELGYATVL